jgi:hypothetical protein
VYTPCQINISQQISDRVLYIITQKRSKKEYNYYLFSHHLTSPVTIYFIVKAIVVTLLNSWKKKYKKINTLKHLLRQSFDKKIKHSTGAWYQVVLFQFSFILSSRSLSLGIFPKHHQFSNLHRDAELKWKIKKFIIRWFLLSKLFEIQAQCVLYVHFYSYKDFSLFRFYYIIDFVSLF